MLVFPAVLLLLAEHLNSDIASVLGFSFWMYLLFGCTALLWGMAADYWGAGILMVVYFMGAGISGLAAAVWFYDPAKFSICLGALGFFLRHLSSHRIGVDIQGHQTGECGLGYNGIFGNLGLASAPFIAGIGTWLWGPQSAFFILSAMSFSGLFLFPARHATCRKYSGSQIHTTSVPSFSLRR